MHDGISFHELCKMTPFTIAKCQMKGYRQWGVILQQNSQSFLVITYSGYVGEATHIVFLQVFHRKSETNGSLHVLHVSSFLIGLKSHFLGCTSEVNLSTRRTQSASILIIANQNSEKWKLLANTPRSQLFDWPKFRLSRVYVRAGPINAENTKCHSASSFIIAAETRQ